MKILVGVMYCIENEYPRCMDSIRAQLYRNHDHFVIEKLPNKEAHDKLYKTFMERASDYDLFVKIDADMVLARNSFFGEVVDYFRANPDVDDLQIAVSDFFTDRLTYGLHVYSSRMRWGNTDDNIFVDRRADSVVYKRVCDPRRLAPAAFHCPDPSRYQAYHFGLHKAIKVAQYGRTRLNYNAAMNHWYNIVCMCRHYRRNLDIRLAFAVLGAYDAITKKLTHENIDYGSDATVAGFEARQALSDAQVHAFSRLLSYLMLVVPASLSLELIVLARSTPDGHAAAAKRMVSNLVDGRFRKYQKKKSKSI